MTRGPLSFKETDLVRAIKSALKAGLQVARFEITKAGSIVVHAGKADASPVEIPGDEEGDTWADLA